eukprot:3068571-Amphidinium_carterae.1
MAQLRHHYLSLLSKSRQPLRRLPSVASAMSMLWLGPLINLTRTRWNCAALTTSNCSGPSLQSIPHHRNWVVIDYFSRSQTTALVCYPARQFHESACHCCAINSRNSDCGV